MNLRENAGGDKNLFSVERKMQKQKRKLEQKREKKYLREKQREKNNVFNFMNTTLGNKGKLTNSVYLQKLSFILYFTFVTIFRVSTNSR